MIFHVFGDNLVFLHPHSFKVTIPVSSKMFLLIPALLCELSSSGLLYLELTKTAHSRSN